MVRVALLAVWLLIVASSAFAAEPAFKRWAVIASPELQQSGVSDLLFAELSAKSFELVEREELAAVTKEIELAKLFGADAAAGRLKVGQLAKADALVLLSVVEHEKQRFVKLVVSDCRYGSRLRRDQFRFKAEQADEVAKNVAQAVIETRSQFLHGVERILAVTPLLSKNVSHDFDRYSIGFATLLGEAEARRQGTVLLEIEEARAINAELAVSTSQTEARQVPWVVEGEFRFKDGGKNDEKDAEPRVQISLQARNGKSASQPIDSSEVPLSKAVEWLTTKAGSALMPQAAERGANVSRDELRTTLTSRADRFAVAGAFTEAAALREAAVTLDPADWEQRLRLAGDYLSLEEALFREIELLPIAQRFQYPSAELEPKLHRIQSSYQDLMLQVLSERRVNVSEVRLMLSRWGDSGGRHLGRNVRRTDWADRDAEFFWKWAGAVRNLPEGPQPQGPAASVRYFFRTPSVQWIGVPFGQLDNWGGDVLLYLIMKRPYHRSSSFATKDDAMIGELDRFVQQVFPNNRLLGALTPRLLRNGQGSLPNLIHEKRVPLKDVTQMYERWQQSPESLIQLYARLGVVGLKVTGITSEPVTPEDLEVLTAAHRLVTDWRNAHANDQSAAQLTLNMTTLALEDLKRLQKTGTRFKKYPPTINPNFGKDPYPRIEFEPLVDVPSPWTGLQKCRADLDVMWSPSGVWMMRKPGVVDDVYVVKSLPGAMLSNQVFNASWDGKSLWVASQTLGVQQFDESGKLLQQWKPGRTEEGRPDELPLFDGASLGAFETFSEGRHPLAVYAVEPGRCLVTGRCLSDGRRWFGVIGAEKNRPREFRIWHQTQGGAQRPLHDIQTAFAPSCLFKWRPSADSAEIVVVGRSDVSGNMERKPLAFGDPAQPAWVLPSSLGSLNDFKCQHPPLVGNNLLFVTQSDIRRVELPQERDGVWKPQTLWKDSGLGTEESRRQYLEPNFFVKGPHVLNMGNVWKRIDTRTWEVESLTDDWVSWRFRFPFFAESAHFGLVAWHWNDVLNRVHVDKPPKPVRNLAWLYPFVPQEHRERHHRALVRIRELGGSVDECFEPPSAWRPGAERQWAATVHLGKAWRGTDADLKLLSEVRGLRTVQLVDVRITDAGLSQLAGCSELDRLVIEDTHVTADGLKALKQLPKLSRLQLEGTLKGHELGDEAIEILRELPRVTWLQLKGTSFSDRTLEIVSATKVTFLGLADTSTTSTAIDALRAKRPVQVHVAQQLNSPRPM